MACRINKQEILESYEATCQKNGISPDYDAIDLSVLEGETYIDVSENA